MGFCGRLSRLSAVWPSLSRLCPPCGRLCPLCFLAWLASRAVRTAVDTARHRTIRWMGSLGAVDCSYNPRFSVQRHLSLIHLDIVVWFHSSAMPEARRARLCQKTGQPARVANARSYASCQKLCNVRPVKAKLACRFLVPSTTIRSFSLCISSFAYHYRRPSISMAEADRITRRSHSSPDLFPLITPPVTALLRHRAARPIQSGPPSRRPAGTVTIATAPIPAAVWVGGRTSVKRQQQ